MTQKVALITGGASGIGKSTAMILARKGINVVISGRREGLGKKAVEEIRSQGGGDAAFIAADVDNEAQVRGMVEFAVKKYRPSRPGGQQCRDFKRNENYRRFRCR